MTGLVVDASVAIKWLIDEIQSAQAVAVLERQLAAPDLLIPECANILWKKVARGELFADEARLAAATLEQLEIDIYPMRSLLVRTTGLALALDHPAYNCVYLALAEHLGWPLCTADRKLVTAHATQGSQCRASLIWLGDLSI